MKPLKGPKSASVYNIFQSSFIFNVTQFNEIYTAEI